MSGELGLQIGDLTRAQHRDRIESVGAPLAGDRHRMTTGDREQPPRPHPGGQRQGRAVGIDELPPVLVEHRHHIGQQGGPGAQPRIGTQCRGVGVERVADGDTADRGHGGERLGDAVAGAPLHAQRRGTGVVVQIGIDLVAGRGHLAGEIRCAEGMFDQDGPASTAPAAQPGAPGVQPLLLADPHAEHQPAITHRGLGEHRLGLRRIADVGADTGLQRLGNGVDGAVGQHQQMQPGVFTQQQLGPVLGGQHGGGQPAQGRRDGGRLGVDHAGRDRLVGGERAVGLGQAGPDLVGEPHLQLGQSRRYPGPALLDGSLRRRGRGLGLGRGRRLGRPAREPLRREIGGRLLGRHRAAGPAQQQRQRVLARKLAARAGALVRGPGQIDDRLIRLGAAALAQPPHRAPRGSGLAPATGQLACGSQ